MRISDWSSDVCSSDLAHDLNWMAEAGLLSLVEGKDGVPAMPATAVADVGGGPYPAVINILLALVERGRTGLGRHIANSQADSLRPEGRRGGTEGVSTVRTRGCR